MNRFPLWKNLLVILAVVIGSIYALPNIYPPDPALQIVGNSQGAVIDEELLNTATSALQSRNIPFFGEELAEDGSALLRLNSLDDQLAAKAVVDEALMRAYAADNRRYVVALNRASTTPEWLQKLGATPMNLGLDLAGGVHFLLEVDTPKAVRDQMEDLERSVRQAIRDQRLFGVEVQPVSMGFDIVIQDSEQQDAIISMLRDKAPQLDRRRASEGGRLTVQARMTEQAIQEIEDHAVTKNLTTLRNRVNELGVSEPLVQKQGRNRIVVEVPGVQDTAGATPTMMDSPQPLCAHSSAWRITFTLPMHSKL